MANQTKIPPWKLPGAIGWEGWPDVPVEFEKPFENELKNHLDPTKPAMAAIGSLNFIVNEAPAVLEAIGGVFTDYIFQGEKTPTPPSPKEQEQNAQAAYSRENYQRQAANAQVVQAKKAEVLQETIQSITGGQMSTAEVVQAASVEEVGKSHVVFLWNQRLQKMEEARAQQKEQKVASTNKKGFTMGEGELLKGGENQHHFTQVAG